MKAARFAVFASGSGSNMQALVDHAEAGAEYEIVLLVTDRSCAAEERARAHGIPHRRVDFRGWNAAPQGGFASGSGAAVWTGSNPTGADLAADAVLRLLEEHRADGVLLAGFLKLLPAAICAALRNRILNIHPALLPSFGGRGMYGHHVHEAVLASGAAVSGPTVHFVDERYDEGPIMAQQPVPVLPGDTANDLAARVLKAEHALYPAAADALARALARGWPDEGPAPRAGWGGLEPQGPRALVSVSDKRGVAAFASGLVDLGWEVLSTGGTARALRDAGVAVTEVALVTGHPEMMQGRVKTLHPAIHAGLLARRDDPRHMEELAAQGYAPIDLVAVNLYPFRETVADPDATLEAAMENVDIGGPTLLRAAAKNHRDVWVVADPDDYRAVMDAIREGSGRCSGLGPGAAARPTREPAAADDAGPGLDAAAQALRRRLATRVYREISAYDSAIADWLEGGEAGRRESGGKASGKTSADDPMPRRITLELEKRSALRYGENPGQDAAFYAPVRRAGDSAEDPAGESAEDSAEDPARDLAAPAAASGSATPAGDRAALLQLQGRSLSYNNILDVDGALFCLAPFAFARDPAVVIVKHTTPCGVAVAPTPALAFERARATDPVSAFGSVIALNRPVDADAATAITAIFVECVVAPDFTLEAAEILARKKSLRLLRCPESSAPHDAEPLADDRWLALDPSVRAKARFLARAGGHAGARSLRSVHGGFLRQSLPDPPFYGLGDGGRVVTRREPDARERDDLDFAWSAVAGVKSNAILLARDGATVGIGAGQMSRVDSSRLAVEKAARAGLGGKVKGCALASDAFFPFRDGVDAAAEAGVTAIVQPGGSVRDAEVIEAANDHGIAMVFTGRRLFRH